MVIYSTDRIQSCSDTLSITEDETDSIIDAAMEQLFTTMLDSDDDMLIFADEI